MREDSLPNEFAKLTGKVNYIQKVSSSEWSSSCPQCGGTPHKHGEPPDRFRMWTNANGKNKIMGWCRRCSYVWFPENSKPIDREEFDRWRKEQIEIERQRKLDAERAIALLQSKKPWEQYHLRLNEWAISLLEKRGITKEYADYWQLGLCEDFLVNGEYHSPALTIPIWQHEGKINNVKLRILNPKVSGDRYRNLYKMGQTFPFVAWPDTKHNVCLIVEGEFKAMVSAAYSNHKYQVVGVPSKTPSREALAQLDRYENLVVCLDPDASEDNALTRMVTMLGRDRVRVAQLAGKIDDMIVEHGLDVNDVVKYAKKMEA